MLQLEGLDADCCHGSMMQGIGDAVKTDDLRSSVTFRLNKERGQQELPSKDGIEHKPSDTIWRRDHLVRMENSAGRQAQSGDLKFVASARAWDVRIGGFGPLVVDC